MTVKENKELIRRCYEEGFNTGDGYLFTQFFAEDFVDHDSGEGQPPGSEGVRSTYDTWISAFPDSHATIEDMVAEDDKIAVRVTLRATHLKPFKDIAPTHKKVELKALNIFRIYDGKIKERWGLTEGAKLIRYLKET